MDKHVPLSATVHAAGLPSVAAVQARGSRMVWFGTQTSFCGQPIYVCDIIRAAGLNWPTRLVDDLCDKGIGIAKQPRLQGMEGREIARRGISSNINRAGGIDCDATAAHAVLRKILVAATALTRARRCYGVGAYSVGRIRQRCCTAWQTRFGASRHN